MSKDDDWLEGGDDDNRVSVKLATKAELALATGLTIVQIDRLVRDGAPVARRGTSRKEGLRFSLPDFITWYVERVASRRAAAGTGFITAKERGALAQARLRELEIAEKEGSLIETESVAAYLGKLCAEFRTAVMQIPAQASGLSSDQRSDIDRAVHMVLADLSHSAEAYQAKTLAHVGPDEVDDVNGDSE